VTRTRSRGRFSPPHLGQLSCSGAAHSIQNFAPSGFSAPQRAQCIRPLYSSATAGAIRTSHFQGSGSYLLKLPRQEIRKYHLLSEHTDDLALPVCLVQKKTTLTKGGIHGD